MDVKLIIAVTDDEITYDVIDAAREAGATGDTIITRARGEGLKHHESLFYLDFDITSHRDVVLLLVESDKCARIMEAIARVGFFDERNGAGIAFQLDVNDAVGLKIKPVQS